MPVTLACVRKGDKYSAEYVQRLQRGIARHMPHKDWEFVCLTDRHMPGILCESLTENLPGWWSKIELFKMGEPLIYFDLDVVITGSLAPLLDWEGFGIIKDWWLPGFNSSVMKLTGNEGFVFDEFLPEDMSRCYMGDQQWISEELSGAKTFPPAWFPSYKAGRHFAEPPKGAIACIFHGAPKPSEITDGWVAELWA